MPLSRAQQSGACNGAGHLRDGVDTGLSNVHQSNGTHSFLCCSPNTSPIASWVHASTRLLTHAPPPVPSHCNQILAYQKVNSQLIKCPHHHDYKTKSSQTGTFRCSMKYISIHLIRMSCSVSDLVNGQLKILSATDGVYQKLHYTSSAHYATESSRLQCAKCTTPTCSLEVTYEFLILNRIYSYNVLQQISPE